MKDQILKIIEAEGLTPARFADEIGVQRSSISHIISGRNKPSYDFILKIIRRFSGINAEWLLTGQGSMIKSSADNDLPITELFDQAESKPVKQADKRNDDKDSVSEKLDQNLNSLLIENKSKEETKLSSRERIFDKVTNVNYADFILVFYKDGTFKRFTARE